MDENGLGFPNCQKEVAWNGFYCTDPNLGILLFESLDNDTETRIVSPITVQSLNYTSRNVLNSFMNHGWDGFYSAMTRLSRFPALLSGGNKMWYNINYMGTPPQKQRFSLRSHDTQVSIQIRYPQAGSYIILDYEGVEIPANAWDNSIRQPGLVKGQFCGENRFLGVVNILEFYLDSWCNITIQPIDSIKTNIRLNWTMSEFFASGGTTTFADRIAAALGIKAQNVKVVSVYEGSVVLDFNIAEDPSGSLSRAGGVSAVQTKLVTQLTSNSINLGAPILSVSVTTTQANSTGADVSAQTSAAINIPLPYQLSPGAPASPGVS